LLKCCCSILVLQSIFHHSSNCEISHTTLLSSLFIVTTKNKQNETIKEQSPLNTFALLDVGKIIIIQIKSMKVSSTVIVGICVVNLVLFVMNSVVFVSKNVDDPLLMEKPPYVEMKAQSNCINCPQLSEYAETIKNCKQDLEFYDQQLKEESQSSENLQREISIMESKVFALESELKSMEKLVQSTSHSLEKTRPWLGIVMPSVPRKNITYLDIAFDSIFDLLPSSSSHPAWGKVKVFVVNNFFPGEHLEFLKIQDKIRSHPKASFFEFYESERRLREREQAQKQTRSLQPESNNDEDKSNFNTGRKLMRQIWGDEQEQIKREAMQTLDLIETLEILKGRAEHFMFMEDDMYLCPGAIEAIFHTIDKAHRRFANFKALRFSFGLNGILIKNQDIPSLQDYWRKMGTGGPNHLHSPDMLVLAYWAGSSLGIFRHNLMEHKGFVSTFQGRDHGTDYLKCWEVNRFWPQFNEGHCRKDDFQPCHNDDIYLSQAREW